MRWVVILLVLLAGVLGGCLGGDDLEDTEGEDADAAAKSSTGIVQGRIFTQDLDPLAGASIALVEGDQVHETKSAADGRYEIRDVAPGSYRLQVNAACCREAVRGVQVIAGETITVDAQLEYYTEDDLRTPRVADPYWEGLLSCGVVVLEGAAVNCGLADPNNNRTHSFEVEKGLQTVLVAMVWDSELTNLLDGMLVDLMHGSNRLAEGIGQSPIEYRVDRADDTLPEFDDTSTLRFEVWAGGTANVIYQQPFTVYWEEYYWQPAPDGASALPDG